MTEFKSQAITYDADGNRINDGRLNYSWDGLGKLTAIEEVNGTKKWQFVYDEQGRRIQKTGPSGTIRFHYDGDSNRLMAETDTAGKPIREYVYNADHILVGLKTNGTWYNYQRNYRGDIVAITDMDGKVAAKYTYDTWGKPLTTNIIDSKLTGQPIRYASYYYDEDLALYYLMARYYHPEQAVFLSIDPELDADETVSMSNGYSYADNSPVLKVDPDGTWAWIAVQAGYGAYTGYKTAKSVDIKDGENGVIPHIALLILLLKSEKYIKLAKPYIWLQNLNTFPREKMVLNSVFLSIRMGSW